MKAAVVGVGALGSVASQLLARSGVTLTVIDRDFVEASNLGRQLLYTKQDIGMPKALAAKKRLDGTGGKVKAVVSDLSCRNASLLDSDVVLDCTDNFEARFLINDYCRKNGMPWVHAAVVRGIGTVFPVTKGACFRCVFDRHSGAENCDTAGVEISAVAATAALQVGEALKVLDGRMLASRLVRLNVSSGEILELKVKKSGSCAACSGSYDYLECRKGSRAVRLCGSGAFQITGRPVNLRSLAARLKKAGIPFMDFTHCLHFRNVALFADGRAIVKAPDERKARSVYARLLG